MKTKYTCRSEGGGLMPDPAYGTAFEQLPHSKRRIAVLKTNSNPYKPHPTITAIFARAPSSILKHRTP